MITPTEEMRRVIIRSMQVRRRSLGGSCLTCLSGAAGHVAVCEVLILK